MDIESLATAAVKKSISWTDRLVPYIPEKDKEPIWDGSVHVYSSSVKSNENNIGRVPMQVKGKAVSKFKSSERFDVPVCELKSYLSEGGVIFFVVELSESTEQTKIFYNSLLPYDLIKLIEAAKQHVSKRITLVPFPTKREDKIDVFTNFISARKKQRTTSSIERIIPLEEFVKQGYPLNLSISFTQSQPGKDILDHFIDNGMYLYFNSPLGVSYPVEHLTNIEMVTVKIEEPISCHGKQYYSHYSRSRKKNISELSFGKAFRFTVDDDKKSMNLKVKLTGTLCERITDCEFVIAVFQEKGFDMGSRFMPIDLSTFDGGMIETWQNNLAFLQSIKSALDSMGVIKDLDCDKLSDEDDKKIRYWLMPAVSGQPIHIDPFDAEYQPTILSICNLNILVMAVKQADGRYLLKNFFDENGSFALQAEDGTMVPSSCYAVLKKDDFIRLSNLDYNRMVMNMRMEMPHPLYCEKVNFVVLNLLAAYDDTSRSELLHTAKEMTEWLCSVEQDNTVFRLNLLQIIKRKRALNCTEIQWLQTLVVKQSVQDECKMGAYILLEDFESASTCYKALPPERKAEYTMYPIMAMWKN